MRACESPLLTGPNKGKPASGTRGGIRRHKLIGESVCDDCREAELDRQAARRGGQRRGFEKSWNQAGRMSPLWVTCRNCGTRGPANPMVVRGRRSIGFCSYCREAS